MTERTVLPCKLSLMLPTPERTANASTATNLVTFTQTAHTLPTPPILPLIHLNDMLEEEGGALPW
eukprot:2465016-Rhodomonas_salina.1